MKPSSIVLLFVLALGLFTSACGSKSPTSPGTVSTVTVSGAAPAVGATSQFVAVAMLASGSSEDITTSATWTSSDISIATVSSTGVVTAVGSGAAVISATFSGVSGTDAITVP